MKSGSNENSEKIIQEAWQEERCPIINGIIWGTGGIKTLDVDVIHSQRKSQYTLTVSEEADIEAFQNSNQLEWTYITQLFERVDEKRCIRVSCGEGAMGADGFVAVSDSRNDHLLWIAFFDCSNPFVKIDINNEEIIAITTLENVWRFPYAEPEKVFVE